MCLLQLVLWKKDLLHVLHLYGSPTSWLNVGLFKPDAQIDLRLSKQVALIKGFLFESSVSGTSTARYHTFVEIDHEIISTVILLPSADLFKKGCCQLQAKVCAQITG